MLNISDPQGAEKMEHEASAVSNFIIIYWFK
jgi:hypothetical protein